MKLEFYNTAAQREAGSQAENMHLPKKSHTSFLKTLLLLVLMLVGVNVSWGIGLSKEIALPATTTNDQGSWDAGTKILSWTEGHSNAINVAAAQDLSGYMGITVDSYNLTSGATFRIILESGGKSYQYVMNSAGVHQILFSDFKIDGTNTAISSEELKNAKIQMAGRYGGEGTRSVKINRLGLIQVKWWTDRKVTISDPNDFTNYHTTQNGNSFTFNQSYSEVRIFLDGSNANEIGSVTLNTSDNSKVKIGGWMSGTRDNGGQWYPTLEQAKAANAKITELDIQVTETGTYTINSIEFTQPYEVNYSTSVSVPSGCEWWYTEGTKEDKIKETKKFAPGTKIVFHATDAGDDHKIINGWRKSGIDGDAGWLGYGDSYTVASISEDLNIVPEFQNCFRVFVNAENGATATVTGGSGKKYFWQATDLSFSTTVPDGYTFDGWYNGSSRLSGDNPYSYGTYRPGNGTDDLTLTAKFKANAPTHQYTPKPTCGGMYFGQNTLEKGANITAFEMLEGGHAKVTTSETQGGYVSFFFENPLNLTEINKWTVGCVDGKSANVDYVAFCKDGNVITDAAFYTNAADRILENQHKSKLASVDEIRIGFKTNTETTIDFFYLEIKHDLASKVPILASPTTSEMEIMEGSTLQLRISDNHGFWREYTDNTYSATTSKISGEWKPSYDITDLKPGDYYFGIKDEGDCAIGNHHATELVKVHVHVKELPNCTVTTTQNSADKGTVNVNGDKLNITYQHEIEGKNVTVQVNNTQNVWSDHDDITCDGFRMTKANNTELLVNAPAGYRVKYVKVNFCKESKYNVSFNRGSAEPQGTANFVEYTQNATNEYKDMVRMTIRTQAGDDESELHIKSVYVKIERMKLDESRTIQSSNIERKYWIYVPENVMKGSAKNVPVVFSLHGGGEDYKPTNIASLNFNSLADQNNFIVVYPCAENQLFPLFNPNPAPAWLCTGNKNDDTQLFEDIIEELKNNTEGYSIDGNKIYMAGFSVGGMMAYAAANCLSDKFAAFASISGLPMNETHLRHHGDRPVPFLHVHGTKDNFVRYEHMPTIIDNMVARNGQSYTPTSTSTGTATLYGDATTTYTKYVYGNESDKSATPYIYYKIGTGMNATDTGMGHNDWCRIGSDEVEKVMWDFFSGRSLPTSLKSDIEFAPQINGMAPGVHNGWRIKENNNLVNYGESGGYNTSTQNVYHSLQLNAGVHYLKFHVDGGDTDDINVRINKIGNLDAFNNLQASFSTTPEEIVNLNYKAKQDICVKFTTSGNGEYQLLIVKANKYANISVTDLSIKATGTATGTLSDKPVETDFGGYYNYNQRLFAQWNFDLCDGYRFNVKNLDPVLWSSDYATTDTGNSDAKNGTAVFTYIPSIGPESDKTIYSDYAELTYNGTNKIPAFAGLKFMANEGDIKVHVDYQNGVPTGARLVVGGSVKLLVPYVENTYRSDANDSEKPAESKDPETGVVTPNTSFGNYQNCMHHIKRDIVYIALHEGSVWDNHHIENKCVDDDSRELFFNGGDEFVNGHTYQKGDYMGSADTPCVIQFKAGSTTIIDRIGVNRNLTFSFYSEYIDEYGVPQPVPGTRIIGSPTGLKVANCGSTSATYENAIAMTFGGWTNQPYTDDVKTGNGEETTPTEITDSWSELGVYNGQEKFYTWADMPAPTASTDVPSSPDGFPVFSRSDSPARSETLMPRSTSMTRTFKIPDTENVYETVASHHPANDGLFLTGTNTPNVTPWSLPCRGAYLKFEPSRPGVLNVHILQRANATYHIVDEFGLPLEDEIFYKTSQHDTDGITNLGGGKFKLKYDHSDYAKYSFNVYPGKTYYMFSNDAGMGMTGFYYEPYVYRYKKENVPSGKSWELARYDVGMKTVNLTLNNEGVDVDGTPYVYPGESVLNTTEHIYSPTSTGNVDYPIEYSNKAVTVQIKRHFNADKWNTICLPFSMNQVEMEQVFGKGTRVVLLRDVQPGYRMPNGLTTLNYIYHENQDIMAGYPYFICPTQTVDRIETNVYLNPTAPNIVSIGSEGPLTIPSFEVNGTPYSDYDGYSDWTFTGTFTGEEIPNGSFVISGGNLCKLENANGKAKMNPYRAYMKLNNPSGAKTAPVIDFFATGLDFIEGEEPNLPTQIDIEQALQDQGIFTQGVDVYTVDGKRIRSNAINLQNLPKGIYVVNKKKYVVK